MKKFIFSLVLLVIATLSYSQADTVLQQSNMKEYLSSNKSLVISLPVYTFADTSGTDDSLYVEIKTIFSTAFMAHLVSQMSGVTGNATGLVVIQQAPTKTGPWVTINSTAVAHNALNPAPTTFKVQAMYLRAILIGTAEIASIRAWLTLKPSSIN